MNMNDPIASLLGSWSTELNLYSVLLRVAVSVVFAAIIGCERASKRHAAGQRTFILVSLASTVAMMLDKSFAGTSMPLISAAAVIAIAIINNPQGVYYGGQVAAPIIRQLYENILPYLGLEKTEDTVVENH